MKICFGGDVFLGGDLASVHKTPIVDVVLFNQADVRIVNLEQPVSDGLSIANKCTLYTPSKSLERLRFLRVAAVNLANNHIQDKGLDAIEETTHHLTAFGIAHFGAGENISAARAPYWVSGDIALLGYCDHSRAYLKEVAVAEENQPGVNPLRFENIIADLDRLPDGSKAILYFHWGREHVWLPPSQDIKLVKRLLEHDKVLLILGMHAHRIQGIVSHAGKRAYMCLGNFLFPNFWIAPPTQIAYPAVTPKNYRVTRQYHSVSSLTYKKWRAVNRVSLLVSFDTQTKRVQHTLVAQADDSPEVRSLQGTARYAFVLWLATLSVIQKLPTVIYSPLEKFSAATHRFLWKVQIYHFHAKEIGWFPIIRKLVRRF